MEVGIGGRRRMEFLDSSRSAGDGLVIPLGFSIALKSSYWYKRVRSTYSSEYALFYKGMLVIRVIRY